jgi:hypothetical protein
MNNELERIWKEAAWPNLIYYPGFCLKELRYTTKILCQKSRSPDRDFNLGHPEYEADMLTTWP